MTRINNPESCVVCARRADGLAVGRRGWLGWYCHECGPDNARRALDMKNMDDVEQRACLKVAEELAGEVTLTPEELPAFIAWCVKAFAENMRRDIENGAPPF